MVLEEFFGSPFHTRKVCCSADVDSHGHHPPGLEHLIYANNFDPAIKLRLMNRGTTDYKY
jgi:hypothetical protein